MAGGAYTEGVPGFRSAAIAAVMVSAMGLPGESIIYVKGSLRYSNYKSCTWIWESLLIPLLSYNQHIAQLQIILYQTHLVAP